MIRYLLSDDDPRNFGAADLPEFTFYGHSVFNLRAQVGFRENRVDVSVVCVKAGLYGRLMPLVTDLPRCQDRMDIVVFTDGSPGEDFATVFP